MGRQKLEVSGWEPIRRIDGSEDSEEDWKANGTVRRCMVWKVKEKRIGRWEDGGMTATWSVVHDRKDVQHDRGCPRCIICTICRSAKYNEISAQKTKGSLSLPSSNL